MDPAPAPAAIEFGRFRVLPHRRELVAEGRAVELGERAFDVLMIGKHLNMFLDRKSLEINFVDDRDAYLQQLMDIVHGKVLDNELPVTGANATHNDGLSDTGHTAGVNIVDVLP
jgi:hypothetical protein